MQRDSVSIIIPAYNAEKSIYRAINSCIGQSHNCVEIVVVNDGSKDNTSVIVEQLCTIHKNISLINVENGGVSKARNIGMQASHGEYIMFLDADDELLPNAAELMMDCLKETSADIVSCRYKAVKEGDKLAVSSDISAPQVYVAEEALLRAVEDRPETYSACAKLYKRSAIKDVRFPEGMRVNEDSFFVFMCLLQKVRLAVLDETVYLYHINFESASRTVFSEKFFDGLELAEEKAYLLEKSFPQYGNFGKNIMVKAHMSLLLNLAKTKWTEYKEQKKESVQFLRKNRAYFIAIGHREKLMFFLMENFYQLFTLMFKLKNIKKYKLN